MYGNINICLSAIRTKPIRIATKTKGEIFMWAELRSILDRNAIPRCTGFVGFRG